MIYNTYVPRFVLKIEAEQHCHFQIKLDDIRWFNGRFRTFWGNETLCIWSDHSCTTHSLSLVDKAHSFQFRDTEISSRSLNLQPDLSHSNQHMRTMTWSMRLQIPTSPGSWLLCWNVRTEAKSYFGLWSRPGPACILESRQHWVEWHRAGGRWHGSLPSDPLHIITWPLTRQEGRRRVAF